MPMSGDRSGDHYTMVADTRRRWSAAEKAAIVAEASGSCPNISAVARRNGINPSLLFRWRKALAKPDCQRRSADSQFVGFPNRCSVSQRPVPKPTMGRKQVSSTRVSSLAT